MKEILVVALFVVIVVIVVVDADVDIVYYCLYCLLNCRLQTIMWENVPLNIAEHTWAGRMIHGLFIGVCSDHMFAISIPEHVAVAPHKDTVLARTAAATRGARWWSCCRPMVEDTDDAKWGYVFAKSMQWAASTTLTEAASPAYPKRDHHKASSGFQSECKPLHNLLGWIRAIPAIPIWGKRLSGLHSFIEGFNKSQLSSKVLIPLQYTPSRRYRTRAEIIYTIRGRSPSAAIELPVKAESFIDQGNRCEAEDRSIVLIVSYFDWFIFSSNRNVHWSQLTHKKCITSYVYLILFGMCLICFYFFSCMIVVLTVLSGVSDCLMHALTWNLQSLCHCVIKRSSAINENEYHNVWTTFHLWPLRKWNT